MLQPLLAHPGYGAFTVRSPSVLIFASVRINTEIFGAAVFFRNSRVTISVWKA